MTTNFPTNPDTYTTKVDGVDTVMAAHINNLQDAMMAVEDFALDLRDGWCYDTDTWVYVSPTSFKIAGKDVRYRFPKGTKIKLVQSGVTKFFYVIATTYSTDTTVTITGGSDYTLASATISGQAYSYADTPQDFPLAVTMKIRVERSTNQSIPDNEWTALSFNTVVYEGKPTLSASQWSSGSPTRLTCIAPGTYIVIAHTRIYINTTGARGINLRKNGVGLVGNIYSPSPGFDASIQVSDLVELSAGDYVETFVFQNSGAALDAVATSNNLYIEWIRLGI